MSLSLLVYYLSMSSRFFKVYVSIRLFSDPIHQQFYRQSLQFYIQQVWYIWIFLPKVGFKISTM